MAFGQPGGPPASHSKMRELLELVEQAGHTDFRDARGALGLTQRQAGGKFTVDEADALIQELQETAWAAEAQDDAEKPDTAPAGDAKKPMSKSKAGGVTPIPKSKSKAGGVTPIPKSKSKAGGVTPIPKSRAAAKAKPIPKSGQSNTDRDLRNFSDEDLAAELQRRGWVVLEP